MGTSLTAASYQGAIAQTNSSIFTSSAVSGKLSGGLVREADGTFVTISKNPFWIAGEWVLKPALDSLGYWAGRSVEMWKGFLSIPGVGAAKEKTTEEIVAAGIEALGRQFLGNAVTIEEKVSKRLQVPERRGSIGVCGKGKDHR